VTDSRLRADGRRAALTGALEDEAAWLLGRLRAGELPETRLRLLVHLDHPAARLALGESPPAPRTAQAWRRWAEGLAAWGRPVCAHAAVAIARACVSSARAPRRADRRLLVRLVDAAERAVLRPSRDALREVREARGRAASDPAWLACGTNDAIRARNAALEAADAVTSSSTIDAAKAAGQAAAWAGAALDLRAPVREALTGWALGAAER
jgi:hypothetical protein